MSGKSVGSDAVVFWPKHDFSFLSCAYDAGEVLKVLNRFYKRKEMQKLASDHGLDGEEFTCHSFMSHLPNVCQKKWGKS